MKYQIDGGNLPVVTCYLENGEAMITQSGGMSWMTPNMTMQTSAGGVGKALGRMFSGETAFLNIYTATNGPGRIAFSSRFPGSIMPVEITPQHSLIIQKSAFLASTSGVNLSVFFNHKAKTGIFGGEGFIMQKLDGQGIAFIEVDGSCITQDLAPGESMIIDTGYVAGMDATCTMTVQRIQGAKNVLFGGEGLFNTVVTGPGRLYLQSMPMTSFAQQLARMMPGG